MNYKELLKDNNLAVTERHLLSMERLRGIAAGEKSISGRALAVCFREMAGFLVNCGALYGQICDGRFARLDLAGLQEENRRFYQDIMPQNYSHSYANPAYAVAELGEEYGRILSFLYTELRGGRVYAFEQDLEKLVILEELFLEIYFLFENDEVRYKNLKECVYDYFYDYADILCGWRVREMFDPGLRFAYDIVMRADLDDPRYLYRYGEYISENELAAARYLNTLPEREIEEIAFAFTDGYREGFALKNVDLSKKETVNIRYPIGFERVIRAAIRQFEKLGLQAVIYRAAASSINKRQNLKIGYLSTNPNPQFDYDHRFDDAIYLDKRMIDRKISCMRKMYETYAKEAAGFAGPACFETFGEEPFCPETKPEAYRRSERQQSLTVEYTALSNELMNAYVNQEERSFTIIAYPIPEIGEDFEAIFEEVRKVNTLDKKKYGQIQQKMIDLLDRSVSVKLMGRGKNMTNLTVSLIDIDDVNTQTKFENCLADVNIPVGEVFTSPKLEGTNGLLHVGEVFLNGLCYKDLRITFEDGMVTEYSCGNFPDPEEGKRFIEENLLFGHKTLPMGEFAIGTNTTAYVMASKYDIMAKLPILIAEKMGPHMALGDTCYSYCEDVRVYNPDGREIMAKENSRSALRREDVKKAYYNCHTDITIPYEELDRIVAVNADRVEVPIILDGRFVLEGTWELNEAFQKER